MRPRRRRRDRELGQGAQTRAKPTEADEVEHWKRPSTTAKASNYTDYAGFVASQPGLDPAKTVDIIDTLIAQSEKQVHRDIRGEAFFKSQLGKAGGAAKQQAACESDRRAPDKRSAAAGAG